MHLLIILYLSLFFSRFHLAASRGHLDCLNLILNHGVDITATDATGEDVALVECAQPACELDYQRTQIMIKRFGTILCKSANSLKGLVHSKMLFQPNKTFIHLDLKPERFLSLH